MFEYIQGKLISIEPNKAVIDCNGVGYSIFIPLSAYSNLTPSLGKNTLLYIDFVVREESQTLFGFIDTQTRQLFQRIRDVSGIGPKTALSIIGHMNLDALEWAIAKQDVATLSKIPGIGKKTAQRLILDLQGKIVANDKSLPPSPATSISHDAISALVNLGYSLDKAQKAVSKSLEIADSCDLSSLISLSLQQI
ncbi:MAG: Holliday junction branch migration protein RuvA [Chlamydiales bacterium]|nr:Holliday junction branch migration protein RuvA [Chlamydiales bacterium]